MFQNSLLKFLYGFELCPYANVIYSLMSINMLSYPEHQLLKHGKLMQEFMASDFLKFKETKAR